MIARALSALGLMKRSEHEEIWLKLDWDNACLSEQIEAERAKFKLATTDLAKQAEEMRATDGLLTDAQMEAMELRHEIDCLEVSFNQRLADAVQDYQADALKWRNYLKRSRDRKAGKKGVANG